VTDHPARKKWGDNLAWVGAAILVWAVVLLVWNFYLVLLPSATYELGPDAESIAMTGKRGQTISVLLRPGTSVGTFWGPQRHHPEPNESQSRPPRPGSRST